MLTQVLILTALIQQPAQRTLLDRIVAVVNDDIIIESELNEAARVRERMDPQAPADPAKLKEVVLNALIRDQLVEQQVRDEKIVVSEDDIDLAIKDTLARNNLTIARLRTALESRGMSMETYREQTKARMVQMRLIESKIKSRVSIPESDIKAEYERRSKGQNSDIVVALRHIYFRWGSSPDPKARQRVLANARKARQRVLNGEKFEDVAKDVSQGPTGPRGGDLGEYKQRELGPSLREGVRATKAGNISEPIETADGVHIMQVINRRRKSDATYESMRNEIYVALYERRITEQMNIWIDELKRKAAISIKL